MVGQYQRLIDRNVIGCFKDDITCQRFERFIANSIINCATIGKQNTAVGHLSIICTDVRDNDICGIKKNGAGYTGRGTYIDLTGKQQRAFAGNFDEAALIHAGGADITGKAGDLIGPNNNLTAIATFNGIGADGASHHSARSILDIGIFTLKVTAYQDGTTAGGTVGVDIAGHGNQVAQYCDAAALTGDAGSIQTAAVGDNALVPAGQENLAIPLNQALGLDDPFIVNHGGSQIAGATGAHIDQAAVGLDQPFIAGQGANRALIDREIDQAVADHIHGDRVTGNQGDRTHTGGDDTFVDYLGGEHHHITAISGVDLALVEDRTSRAAVDEAVVAGEKVGIGDIKGRSHQALDIHLGGGAEDHPVGVDEKNLTIGSERTHDQRGIGGGNPVQGHSLGVRLGKVDRGVLTDVKGVPVGDQLLARLVHRHVGAALADAALA